MNSVKQLFFLQEISIRYIIDEKSKIQKQPDGLKISIVLEKDTGSPLFQFGEGWFSLLGELTDQGRLSTLELGQRIRKLYVDQLGFLPRTLEDENTLYIRYQSYVFRVEYRTTHLQRTVESMAQVFTGLYPSHQVRAIPHFHVRLRNHENLYPNDNYCASHPTCQGC